MNINQMCHTLRLERIACEFHAIHESLIYICAIDDREKANCLALHNSSIGGFLAHMHFKAQPWVACVAQRAARRC